MKKALFVAVLLLIGFSSMVYGQIHKDIYVRSMHIEKVFIHSLGYAIVYYKPSGAGYGILYLPYNWFTEAGGAGEIVWGRNQAYPYISIFWVDGKFSHLKCFFQESLGHPMWENLSKNYSEVKDKFNVTPDTFTMEF
jgi:hypothetical protein